MDYPEEQRIYDINDNGILRRIIWLPTATEISKGLLQQYFWILNYLYKFSIKTVITQPQRCPDSCRYSSPTWLLDYVLSFILRSVLVPHHGCCHSEFLNIICWVFFFSTGTLDLDTQNAIEIYMIVLERQCLQSQVFSY